MNENVERELIDRLTEKIIGCAYLVGNTLGCGFLEKIYENAVCMELRRNGLQVRQQYPVSVYYDEVVVGEYLADVLVEDRVLIELKAVQAVDAVHIAQCLNYLNATGYKVCLLINFGKPKVEVRRVVRGF